MQDNRKQLEDFAYDISNAIEKVGENTEDVSFSDAMKIAKELSRKGYTKVPETAVVIDKEYYNRLTFNM